MRGVQGRRVSKHGKVKKEMREEVEEGGFQARLEGQRRSSKGEDTSTVTHALLLLLQGAAPALLGDGKCIHHVTAHSVIESVSDGHGAAVRTHLVQAVAQGVGLEE